MAAGALYVFRHWGLRHDMYHMERMLTQLWVTSPAPQRFHSCKEVEVQSLRWKKWTILTLQAYLEGVQVDAVMSVIVVFAPSTGKLNNITLDHTKMNSAYKLFS